MSLKRKYGNIWTHFTEDGNQRAKCKYCKASLSFASGCQSNLTRHLKSKHPTTEITPQRQEPNPISIDLDSDAPSTSSQSIQQPVQQTIGQFFRRSPPIRKVEKIDRQVVKIIAKGHHALRIVEEPEFKKLIEVVSQCPGYALPIRKTVSNNLLPSIHMEIMEKVKKGVKAAFAVCLTTGGWISKTNTSFLAITAHFIDENTT